MVIDNLSTMEKCVLLMRNGEDSPGKIVQVPPCWDELLKLASSIFGVEVKVLYTEEGLALHDLAVIKDGQPLYAACVEKFKGNIRSSDWVKLNVGGRHFTTTRNTLLKYPDSMLALMFRKMPDLWKNTMDENGCFLIDRSPDYFEPIINYLRNGVLTLNYNINPRGLLEEARFFGLTSLAKELESCVKVSNNSEVCVSRSEFTRLLMTTPSAAKLRCQGVNFSGADLSYLDLRSINFNYANLSSANLAHASLDGCEFHLADLSFACLDNASLEGVQMKRANLEGASMKNCKFESKSSGCENANLEGANLKGAKLSGCQMSGVDLRLAILKEANMKNCVLREAVLAGADLENCNLTGADLQGANLRGANVVGTVFLDIVTPLHMVHLM